MAGAEGLEVASQPSCGARRCARLERGTSADRGASLRSLFPPPAALASSPDTLCVPRQMYYLCQIKNRHDGRFYYGADIDNGLEVASQPSCGARRCARLERGTSADRGASLRSLFPPPAALASSPDTLRVPRQMYYFCQIKNRHDGRFLIWQGQKDLNPRHAVLETAALPTELYPYILLNCLCLGPSCGARRCARLERGTSADRGANPLLAFSAPGGARRRCPARGFLAPLYQLSYTPIFSFKLKAGR